MGYTEALFLGLAQSISPDVLLYLILGSVIGLIAGVIPGLNGSFATAMIIPFLFLFEPAQGIAFMIAAQSTITQGGGLVTILFRTPGSGQNAVSLLDGPPLVEKGLGAQAVGAGLMASFVGAVFGAVALAVILPVIQQVVLLFGPPEIFMLAFLALTFVAVLGNDDIVRALIAGLIGLLLAFIGHDSVTNVSRFTFGSLSLHDGLSFLAVILGLFAVAEMIHLWVQGGSLAKKNSGDTSMWKIQKQVLKGMGVTLQKWWLVARCGAIGLVMGIIPGLGSAPAAFVAYGHAKQTSKDPDSFGKGNIEGIIGSEAANDSTDGGALVSTVAFGIPGSSSMAILLAGMYILQVDPGPGLIQQQPNIVWIMIFTLIFGNLIGTIVGFFITLPLSKVTYLRGAVIIPPVLVIVFTGAYMFNQNFFDIVIAIVFGIIGYIMKITGFNRAALLIGFILGFIIERNLYMAVRLYGPAFIFEPLTFALLLLTLGAIAYNIWGILRNRKKEDISEKF